MKSTTNGGEVKIDENAPLVVGADGKHSLVARLVQAEEYHTEPVLTCAYYTYWDGIDLDGGEMYSFPQGAVGVWPTNDRLTMIYTAYPFTQFQDVRKNIEARFWKTIESLPRLSERVHNGRQSERFYSTADLPAFYRKAYGPGWALVGDAGMTMDPITGQGIGNAFCDAENLAESIAAAFSGKEPLETCLSKHQRQRDEDTQPMYKFTSQLAAFSPPSLEQQVLFSAMAHKPEAASRFLGFLTGSVPMQEFFSPKNLFNIMGITGMGRILLGKVTTAWKNPVIPSESV